MTLKQKIEKLYKLEDEAISYYLDKTDFDRIEWMFDKQKTEYIKLYKEVNGQCPACGETGKCSCK